MKTETNFKKRAVLLPAGYVYLSWWPESRKSSMFTVNLVLIAHQKGAFFSKCEMFHSLHFLDASDFLRNNFWRLYRIRCISLPLWSSCTPAAQCCTRRGQAFIIWFFSYLKNTISEKFQRSLFKSCYAFLQHLQISVPPSLPLLMPR